MSERIQPKVCAICAVSLDFFQGEWIHTKELVGQADHVAVPVDYDSVQVRTMCDFCYAEVPRSEVMTIPAANFQVPGGFSTSAGNWCACKTCANIIAAQDWEELVDRAAKCFLANHGQGGMPEGMLHSFLAEMYKRLAQHMTGKPRPWQQGDETSER